MPFTAHSTLQIKSWWIRMQHANQQAAKTVLAASVKWSHKLLQYTIVILFAKYWKTYELQRKWFRWQVARKAKCSTSWPPISWFAASSCTHWSGVVVNDTTSFNSPKGLNRWQLLPDFSIHMLDNISTCEVIVTCTTFIQHTSVSKTTGQWLYAQLTISEAVSCSD